jgi:hypothetical protein
MSLYACMAWTANLPFTLFLRSRQISNYAYSAIYEDTWETLKEVSMLTKITQYVFM